MHKNFSANQKVFLAIVFDIMVPLFLLVCFGFFFSQSRLKKSDTVIMPVCSETIAICPLLLMRGLYNMAVYGINVVVLGMLFLCPS